MVLSICIDNSIVTGLGLYFSCTNLYDLSNQVEFICDKCTQEYGLIIVICGEGSAKYLS